MTSYKFSSLFDETKTQEDVYNGVMSKLTRSFLSGENGLVFAYGMTGSGSVIFTT